MIWYTAVILILTSISLYLVYKVYSLKKAIKAFNPVVYTNTENIVNIGKCEVFSNNDEMYLSTQKDILKLFLKKIDYRIASYTAIQNTCYRPSGKIDGEIIYNLKSDSEKWMETGRMNGYLDIRADIEHLVAKEIQQSHT